MKIREVVPCNNDVTLYDLCGSDHQITAFLNPKTKHVLVGVTNESNEVVFSEETHLFAWESLVYLAKQVISEDERIQRQLDLLEGL